LLIKLNTKEGNIMLIYQGPSLIDGSPIVAIAIAQSGNVKTGNMVQTYIIRSDIDPLLASKTGADYSICGACPHRGNVTSDPKRKIAEKRSCYVNLGQGPLIVWKAFQRNIYQSATGHRAIAAIGKGRMVRLGTYGDPAAVPSYVWESLISEATGHTAYSHQSNMPNADTRPDFMMISADNEQQARHEWSNGNRTFRVIKSTHEIITGAEILCPASKEAGFKTTCAKCGLCGGSSVKAKSIAIVDHGPQNRKRA
jgi:hypothetical protein